QTVRFSEATQAALAEGYDAFVEISAHPVVSLPLSEIIDTGDGNAIVVGSLKRDHGELSEVLRSVCKLHVQGVTVDWETFYSGMAVRKVSLPTYAFERQRYWLEPDDNSIGDIGAVGAESLTHR